MQKNKNNKRGFTLIETFVAITILVIAVLGPLSLLSRSISDGNFAGNRVTAFYLAQEGLEMVINKRDNNIVDIGIVDWLDGLGDCVSGSGSVECALDLVGTQIVAEPCSFNNDCQLYLDGDTYTHSSGNPETIFKRRIVITENLGEAKVEAIVDWSNGESDQSLTLTTYIYESL